jgi:hypothetical protein
MFVNLHTDLPLHQFKEHLRTHTGPVTWRFGGGFSGQRDIIGHLFFPLVLLWCRIEYMNSFAPVFYGIVRQDGNGTRLKGVFFFHPLVVAISTVWFWMLSQFPDDRLFFFLAFAFIVGLCLLMARTHVEKILGFLKASMALETNSGSDAQT